MVIPTASDAIQVPGTCGRILPQAARTGRIFDIKRFSSHDGPGIRTTVFLTGCPLRCAWCHNPEAFAHHEVPAGDSRVRELTVPALVNELERDISYFDASNGGITISGGEPLFQQAFVMDLLRACRKRELHTALDTTGCADPDVLLEAASLTDLVLYDLKSMDDAAHREWTGAGNRRILDNLLKLQALTVPVWIRLPLIPGVNDGEANITAVIDFLTPTRFRRVSILPYHRIAAAKYQRLGLTERLAETRPPTEEHVARIRGRFAAAGFDAHVGH